MDKIQGNLLTLLFSAFIILILGAVLIRPIGTDVELAKIGSKTVTNESVTISSGLGTLTYDELLSFDACRNSTGIAVTRNTYCNVTLASGAVSVHPDNFSANIAYIDYKYEPDTYVRSSAARTLLTITVLFFALAILTVGIGYAIKSFKENNLM